MVSKENKSGFLGVSEIRGQGRWAARLKHNGKGYLAYGKTAEEAATKYDEIAKELGIYEKKLLLRTTPKEPKAKKNKECGSITYHSDSDRWRGRVRKTGKNT